MGEKSARVRVDGKQMFSHIADVGFKNDAITQGKTCTEIHVGLAQ
jgi:hypothetical protein